MRSRVLTLGVPLTLALLLVFAPATTPTRAQMVPSLDQLSGDAFDTAFLAQMTMHHTMAVMMAKPVVANATHPELKQLAQSIIDDQTREIGQMRGWARDWYGVELPDHLAMMDQMMGHGQSTNVPSMGHSGMPMQSGMPVPPGMSMGPMGDMSMMESFWKLPPQRLEVVFMSQMIPHHQSAIEMAKLVPERAAHQELKDLAQNVITSQSSEIDQMNSWLSSWYGL
jgi:uncharacterized protein (DUF305 family)